MLLTPHLCHVTTHRRETPLKLQWMSSRSQVYPRRRECGRGGDLAAAGAGSPRPRRLPHVRTSRFLACRRSARCSSYGARRTAKRLIGVWRNPPGAGPTAAEMGPKYTGRRGPARGRRRPRRASRPRYVPGAAAVRAGWRGQRCRKLAPRREAGRPCQGARHLLAKTARASEERSQLQPTACACHVLSS